jgi:hypothetical protein
MEVQMLKSVDILIGLTIVLLALSMAVTMITQSVTTVLNSRGRHLRRGLVDLLQQLDPALTETLSRVVATGILTHPLVSGSNTPVRAGSPVEAVSSMIDRVRRSIGGPRLGNVVHREEFTKLLMAFAAGEGTGQLENAAKDALMAALKENGVENPEQKLKDIRQVALRLEKSSPELSHTARQNIAILEAAESDLVAKINNWFDQTMDRTSQRFTASTRAITFIGAFIVAFGLQVDTPALVNRLAADEKLREQFVTEAKALYADQQALDEAAKQRAAGAAKEPGQTPTTPPAAPATPDQEEMARKYRVFLATNGLITLPSAGPKWIEGFRNVNLFGVLMTALLLSLGAPFWYSLLGRMLQLRSALAVKDDMQRAERQLRERLDSGGGKTGATDRNV